MLTKCTLKQAHVGDFYYIIAFQDANLIYLNWRCTFSDKIIQGSLVSIGESASIVNSNCCH